MDIRAHQNDLYHFVTSNFDRLEFIRAKRDRAELFDQFNTYDDFARHQEAVIINSDIDTLSFIQQFQSLIQLGNIELVDKEDLVPIRADGFFFLNGKILFTNPE